MDSKHITFRKISSKALRGTVLASALLVGWSLQAAAYTQPLTQNIQSVAGFYEQNASDGVFLVHAQADSGTLHEFVIAGQTTWRVIELMPIDALVYPNDNDEEYVLALRYLYSGPLYNLTYASYGYWARVRPQEIFIWGIFAAGSNQNFSLPTTGNATFCGFYDAWTSDGPNAQGIGSMGGPITITTTWKSSTINTFSINGIGAANHFANISKDGTSTFSFPTFGPDGRLTEKATALVKFYGPGAIEISGTFSGNWDDRQIAGAVIARRCN